MTAAPVRQTRTGNDEVRVELVELDLLATHAGRRFPFPLRVPEFGRIPAEREVLLAAAAATLRERGLAGERGPLGIATELVTALREYRGTVDLVLAGPGSVVGVVAMVYRSWALICRQPLTGAVTNAVWVRRVAQSELAEELYALVPDVAPARTMPVTLPPDGADPGVLHDLEGLVGELAGSGQLGATRPELGTDVRSGTELSWLDGPRGRVRVHRSADGWVSVNPLRQNEIRCTLDDLALIARRTRNGT